MPTDYTMFNKKVYIVLQRVKTGTLLEGVFSSEENAQASIDKYKADCPGDRVYFIATRHIDQVYS